MPEGGWLSRVRQIWKDRPRRRRMVVTDITRMEGTRVCVAGFLEDGQVVRPVYRGGPTEAWLHPAINSQIVPFSTVELMAPRRPGSLVPPHTEDRVVPERGHRVVSVLQDAERITWLASSTSPSVSAIFGAEIHSDPDNQWGRFVRAGEGSRSLGTIRPGSVVDVRFAHYPERGRWDYRLRFADATGDLFQLAVVDLAFRGRLNALHFAGQIPDQAAHQVLTELQRQNVYLRLGLARGWDRHPDRCYLQITGVYGFYP